MSATPVPLRRQMVADLSTYGWPAKKIANELDIPYHQVLADRQRTNTMGRRMTPGIRRPKAERAALRQQVAELSRQGVDAHTIAATTGLNYSQVLGDRQRTDTVKYRLEARRTEAAPTAKAA